MTIKESITPEDVLEVLNRMNEADPKATKELFIFGRVPCNEALAKDPTIQVKAYNLPGEGKDAPKFSVGINGLLNGLFGKDEGGFGPISANVALECSKGCELPDEEQFKLGADCPVCVAEEAEKPGTIDFGSIERFTRTPTPEERAKANS